MTILKSLVSVGDVVADIGANVGVYTIELSRLVGPSGKVHAFEPLAGNYDILSTLIRKAHLKNVSAMKAALGAKVAEGEMIIPDAEGFIGYYQARIAQPEELHGKREPVKVLTLDEIFRRRLIERLDFIKCDVEGGELDLIRGGRTTIESQKPAWLMEVSKSTSDEVFAVLQNVGYRAFVFDSRLTETTGYRDKEFSNYFFFHPKSSSWGRVLPHMSTPL